jgi:hypothetical protein
VRTLTRLKKRGPRMSREAKILRDDALFELFREWFFVEKDPRIVVPAIETVLQLLNTGDYTVDIVITTQKDKRRVLSFMKWR